MLTLSTTMSTMEGRVYHETQYGFGQGNSSRDGEEASRAGTDDGYHGRWALAG